MEARSNKLQAKDLINGKVQEQYVLDAEGLQRLKDFFIELR